MALAATSWTLLQILTSLFGSVALYTIYAAWVVIALWEIIHSEKSTGGRWLWSLIVVLLPIVGPIAYYLFGSSKVPGSFKLGMLLVAPVVTLVVLFGLLTLANNIL
ncbi:MAG TPA: PLD nuclease N-terminal domain-containing protein [Ktedonobacterales bacterium]|jgi:hypothetical protein